MRSPTWDAVQRQYDASYARFRSRFCSLEDGMATQRVVDWLLGLGATDAPDPVVEDATAVVA